MDLQKLKTKISFVDELIQIDESESEELRAEGYPSDYIAFLDQIGYGDVGGMQLYSGPTVPSSIYPAGKPDLDGVKIFGDDTQGYCFGFQLATMKIVEIGPDGTLTQTYESPFLQFVEGWLS